MKTKVACTKEMSRYFDSLAQEADICYKIANKARKKGIDPEVVVEIPRAEDLAARVEELVGPRGIAKKIRELSKKHSRELVSILVAREIAKTSGEGLQQKLDQAIRTGLAVLTEGILVAPLEGVVGVNLMQNNDGSRCVGITYAGPIRSAGGTGQAMSVLIADIVRRDLGLDRYKPTRAEIERYMEEIGLYHGLQYKPSDKEIELIISNCPVCVDGEGTEEEEVTGHRDLPRVEGNRVRGGACLVLAEGLCLKAEKIQKHVRALGIDGWEFVSSYLKMKKGVVKKKQSDEGPKIVPNYKYMQDIVAGRPILAYPSRAGGFRLRYGRGRTTGLAAVAIHPATLQVLDGVIAIGTQIKIERPGKAGAVTPCDTIEGPTVLLQNGDLVYIDSEEKAKEIRPWIQRIVDLGEILLPFGEFSENNHLLLPGGFSRDWWLMELKDKMGEERIPDEYLEPDAQLAFRISRERGVPLHPAHNLFWHDIPPEEMVRLRAHIVEHGSFKDGKLSIALSDGIEETLYTIGALHKRRENVAMMDGLGEALLLSLGLEPTEEGIRTRDVEASGGTSNEYVSSLAGIEIKPRSPSRIGARMGRPEKAKERKMSPPPHVLFPIGNAGGAQRLVNDAAEKGPIPVEVAVRHCSKCGKTGFLALCECGGHTIERDEPTVQGVNVQTYLSRAAMKLGNGSTPTIKGVKGMTSKSKTPEPLEKGILRSKNDVYVFKDGTIRYDMTDLPITHFTPLEIGLALDRARNLGYLKDMHGEKLTDEGQLLELRVQDFVASKDCGEYLVKAARFIDDELSRLYGLEPFYKAERPEDLIGHMLIGLAPHTSGGVLVRLIGYTDARVGYGHPFFHAAKRRNCDGDEDCVMLLLDGLLNFSKAFLPRNRGGLMDAPLVLTTRIDPSEIDKEAHNIDVMQAYPLELYRAADRYADPKEVEAIIDHVGSRIGSALQYESFSFTHNTRSISAGPTRSAYTTLETMLDKMNMQLDLAKRIRAVDAADTAARIIENHFMPDLIGNLRKFSTQKFRCTKCNRKYRRIPLAGHCLNPVKTAGKGGNGGKVCGGNLTLTVHKKGVTKYLEISKKVASDYNVPSYMRQRLDLIEESIESLFSNDKVKECSLDDFF